uniref:Mitochondrial ATP synthase g subunit n=1 Tax=Pseudodiaptomus poplesia TaxID=213370 RepID=A0A1S6GLF4_9MAXI|nr:mitochondrial ATP synthase g subunit [Pseudodiaptomus poplesia]
MATFIDKAPLRLVNFAQPRLATFVRYAKVELTPPSPGELGQAVKSSAKLVQSALTFKWATATVGEATVNAIIVAEIACWFFIGECIGKGSLIGYQV